MMNFSRVSKPEKLPVALVELEKRLLESVESLEAGKGVDGDRVIKRLRKRMREARGGK